MRYSERGHHDAVTVEHRRWLRFRHIDNAGLEANAAAGVARRGAKRCPKNLKCPILRIEEAAEKG
jgi:hypothetical protein